jgi:hypothetical protein
MHAPSSNLRPARIGMPGAQHSITGVYKNVTSSDGKAGEDQGRSALLKESEGPLAQAF